MTASYIFVDDADGNRTNLSRAEMQSYVTAGWWYAWTQNLEAIGVHMEAEWPDAESYNDTPLASVYSNVTYEGIASFADAGVTDLAGLIKWLAKTLIFGATAGSKRMMFWASYLINRDGGAEDPASNVYEWSPQAWYDDGMPGVGVSWDPDAPVRGEGVVIPGPTLDAPSVPGTSTKPGTWSMGEMLLAGLVVVGIGYAATR